jgi:hypothetical protein
VPGLASGASWMRRARPSWREGMATPPLTGALDRVHAAMQRRSTASDVDHGYAPLTGMLRSRVRVCSRHRRTSREDRNGANASLVLVATAPSWLRSPGGLVQRSALDARTRPHGRVLASDHELGTDAVVAWRGGVSSSVFASLSWHAVRTACDDEPAPDSHW